MSDNTRINGTGVNGAVAEGFGPVADAFERNFAEHGELGTVNWARRSRSTSTAR